MSKIEEELNRPPILSFIGKPQDKSIKYPENLFVENLSRENLAHIKMFAEQ